MVVSFKHRSHSHYHDHDDTSSHSSLETIILCSTGNLSVTDRNHTNHPSRRDWHIKTTHHKNKHIKSYIKGAIEKYTIEEKKMEGKKSKRRENVFFSAFLTTGLFLLKQLPV